MKNIDKVNQPLAILGGPRSVEGDHEQLFHWPIVTEEDEQAVVAVLRAGTMSTLEITREFEQKWGEFQGTQYNLAHCNGTMALLAAMFGCGVGRGDEIIVPSITYWASAMPCYLLGATPVFADINPVSLCIDPGDITRRITKRTKAIVVVHYCGHPADMDPIIAIAKDHQLKVIEDGSHAHGSLYQGRLCGSLADVAASSMMGGKSFAIGEAGMLSTNNREIYERAVAFCHYERTRTDVHDESLQSMVGPAERNGIKLTTGLPLGGLKGRLNQTCAAMGLVQLKYYPSRIQEIQKAMTRFWDLLEGVPGLRPHRPEAGSGSTMGGWYNPLGHYLPEELGGLPAERFIKAVNAEGGRCGRGANFPLHAHPVFNEADVFGDGKPTRVAFADRDVRQPAGSLPHSEALAKRCIGIPWFKHDQPDMIECYARAYQKVALQADKLL